MYVKNHNVLIVEGTRDDSDLIRLHLEKNYSVMQVYSGEEAIQILNNQNEIDLVILNIILPFMSGIEVLKEIRKKRNIPIIIVSEKASNEDIIIALNYGADDYVAKPFNPLELSARVDAQMRRFFELGASTKIENDYLKVRDLVLDCRECCIYKEDIKILLTNIEFKLMKLFMSDPGRVFSKKQIFEAVWEEEYIYDDNTIMVYISKIRERIGDDSKKPSYIRTVRGLGYKLNPIES